MPTLARKPTTMSTLFLVEIPQNPMVGQQRQHILASSLHFLPSYVERYDSKTK